MSAAQLVWQHLTHSPSVLLTGPRSPDGDSVGACLALARCLVDRGVRCHVAGNLGYRYDWLPAADSMLRDEDVKLDYDTVVVLDGDRHRLTPPIHTVFERAAVKVVIDHHVSTREDEYDLSWVNAEATSTTAMLYRLLVELDLPIDAEMATWLHTGTVFDTGGLKHSNTSAATLNMTADLIARGADHGTICRRILALRRWQGVRAMASILEHAESLLNGQLAVGLVTHQLVIDLDLSDDDTEGVIDNLANIVGVHVAAILYEQPDGRVKVSLRSPTVDVAKVARALVPSGGGHMRAAGAMCPTDVTTTKARLVAIVAEHLRA